MCEKIAGPADGVGGRDFFAGRQCEVIVLDEHGVEQSGAMVVAAAAADGVLFEPPPAGSRFSRVVDAGLGAVDRADELAGPRGDAGEMAQQIQHRPLADEQVAGLAGEGGDGGAGRDFVAIGGVELAVDRRVHFVDDDRQRPQAGDHAWLADDDGRAALILGADDGERGPIVEPIEIFADGEADDLAEVVLDRRRSSRVG